MMASAEKEKKGIHGLADSVARRRPVHMPAVHIRHVLPAFFSACLEAARPLAATPLAGLVGGLPDCN